MDFKGKTAVVTGSSGGIGKAIAVLLAKEGANVVLTARNMARMQEVKKEIEALGRKAVAIESDISSDESVYAMKDKALEAFGNIDILINNAAVGMRGKLENVSLDDWKWIVNTNIMGYVRNVQAFLPHFMARGSGYIVNVSSIQALAFTGEILNVPYITTKAGIIGFTESIQAYLRPKGIKVSCLIPGGVSTEMGINARFVGPEQEQKEMKDFDEQFFKSPFFLKPTQCAEGLLEGMKKEDFFIVVPANMLQMLKAQGKDIAAFNAYIANPPKPPQAPPPKK